MVTTEYISIQGIHQYVRIAGSYFPSQRSAFDLKKMMHIKLEIVVRKYELYNIDDILCIIFLKASGA